MARADAPARPPAARRLALLGGESSGKTTLAIALAERLHVAWVPEYGRQRWEQCRRTLDVDVKPMFTPSEASTLPSPSRRT